MDKIIDLGKQENLKQDKSNFNEEIKKQVIYENVEKLREKGYNIINDLEM